MNHKKCTVIGGGLSGCEASWQLAKRGIAVDLYEMRPVTTTKAHKTSDLAELVCSNSFRGAALTNAVGLLKEELKLLGSLIMEAALFSSVPAGGALAVDRVVFSKYVQEKIQSHPLITIHREEITEIPEATCDNLVILATGPLTSPSLSKSIEKLTGQERLSFFDAISPIFLKESLHLEKMFPQSRWDKGEGKDYLNIPLSKELYEKFVSDVLASEKFGGHEEVESDSIEGLRPFEGCMPIEDMASRGIDTLRHGPLKPTGLTDPATGRWPYACVQLRQDDKEGELWSLVGFQTRMKHGDQMRVLRSLPGLEDAEFVRLGSVHRNSFIDSPKLLHPTLQMRSNPNLFFAGQITGVEGYVESTAGGLVAGINAARILSEKDGFQFPTSTAIGGLMNYITDPSREYFQPMNVSFGIIPSYFELPNVFVNEKGKRQKVGKDERREKVSKQALEQIAVIQQTI
jgi:methylenetetrahydrofolate--tRNA-(uracil-5-)-methyltransferase